MSSIALVLPVFLVVISALVVPLLADPNANKGVCCGDLGCYAPGGDFFNIPNRPVNSIPDCSLTGRIFLRLNTRQNPELTQIVTPYILSTIQQSTFNASRPTKVLTHGFLDRYTRPPWQAVADNLLKEGDYNVIRVDWSQGNVPPYVQACANLRLVGAYVAKFLNVLVQDMKVNPKDIHLIGHSLGAHGSGYAGSLMRTKYNTTIGRITGLDPAGPYFNNMPTIVRLDPTDAAFVDTIVTNGDIVNAFGSTTPMGHLNFYPNGGLNQPGCSAPVSNMLLNTQGVANAAPKRVAAAQTERLLGRTNVNVNVDVGVEVPLTSFDKLGNMYDQDVAAQAMNKPVAQPGVGVSDLLKFVSPDALDLVGCSHNRAVLYFADLILHSGCVITGYQCDSYDLFMESEGGCGECADGTTCSRMGLHVNASLAVSNRIKRFYTVTRALSPYCSNFKVEFTLKAAGPREPDIEQVVGSIYLTIAGTLGKTAKMLVSKPEFINLIPGKSYSFYPELPKDLGSLQSVTLNWKPKSNLFFGINLRTDYIYLDGPITVTDNDGMVAEFTPPVTKVPSIKDLVAPFTRRHAQRK